MSNKVPKCLYKKIYKTDQYDMLYLENTDLLFKYCKERLDDLIKNINNTEEYKNIRLKIVNEFIKTYKYDCSYANMPKQILGVPKEKKEEFIRRKILVEDINSQIGFIFYNVHLYRIRNNLPFPIIEGSNFILHIEDIYLEVLNDYLSIISEEKEYGIKKPEIYSKKERLEKQVDIDGTIRYKKINENVILPEKPIHSYASSFIISALIERALIENLKILLIKECINKIVEENIRMTAEEKNAVEELMFFTKSKKMMVGTKEEYYEKIYNIFVKYNIIPDEKENRLIIIGMYKGEKGIERPTLGNILSSKYGKNKIILEYRKLLLYIFDVNYMNIRNNIMHLNNPKEDYFAINITSVLYEILWGICSYEIFKKERII